MNEYYSDLISGELGGPGLVDGLSNVLLGDRAGGNSLFEQIRDFLRWFFSSLPDISLWIRSTPAVMALASIFFVGVCIALFIRIYHSI